MTTIAIQLPEDKVQRLQALAEQSQVSIEELAAARVLAMLEEPSEEFRRAFRFVMQKHIDLYRRLA